MPRYICKVVVDGSPYYLEWSTVVDAPVTYGLPLEEFTAYYQERYGSGDMEPFLYDGLSEFGRRLDRVNAQGTSCMLGQSFEELTRFNRAGDNETQLSYEEIVDKYVRNRPKE